MPENFPAGQFLRKADKWLGVGIVNYSMEGIKYVLEDANIFLHCCLSEYIPFREGRITIQYNTSILIFFFQSSIQS